MRSKAQTYTSSDSDPGHEDSLCKRCQSSTSQEASAPGFSFKLQALRQVVRMLRRRRRNTRFVTISPISAIIVLVPLQYCWVVPGFLVQLSEQWHTYHCASYHVHLNDTLWYYRQLESFSESATLWRLIYRSSQPSSDRAKL
jgi:hypothetical protein